MSHPHQSSNDKVSRLLSRGSPTCLDPSRRSLVLPVYVLYRHSLICCVLLSSIPSRLDIISKVVYTKQNTYTHTHTHTPVYTVFIVSTCCGLRANKDLNREACASNTNKLRDDRIGTESYCPCNLRGQITSDEGDLERNGACHNKTPPIDLKFSTVVAAPRLTAAPIKFQTVSWSLSWPKQVRRDTA